ncbi:MAG: hypothetical protein HY747_01815, partial [Elusimicrobia bacterium]|nr:hypothetical protein [Elusimicrobiota bacterium]
MPAAEFLTEVCAESPEAAAQAWIIGRSAVSEEDADQCEFTYQLPAEEQEAGGDEEKRVQPRHSRTRGESPLMAKLESHIASMTGNPRSSWKSPLQAGKRR